MFGAVLDEPHALRKTERRSGRETTLPHRLGSLSLEGRGRLGEAERGEGGVRIELYPGTTLSKFR